MTEFTPLASFAGGMMIGLAAVLLMALHGRILGATGLISGLLEGRDAALRAALLLGMIAAPGAIFLVSGHRPALDTSAPMAALLGGGLLAGIGASLGGGCTSGHGVCGNARLSRRSMIATLSFLLTAALTVFLIRHGGA